MAIIPSLGSSLRVAVARDVTLSNLRSAHRPSPMSPPTGRSTKNCVDLDQVFSALSHPIRRGILTAVMKDNPRRQGEFKKMEFRPDDTTKETIEIELRHSHLPQLDKGDFIDWERRSGKVTRGEKFEEIRPLLELMDNHREELPGDWP